MGSEMTAEEIDTAINQSMAASIDVAVNVIGSTLDSLLRQAYSLGLKHGVESCNQLGKAVADEHIFGIPETQLYESDTSRPKKTPRDNEWLGQLGAGISSRIVTVLYKNGITTVRHARLFEHEHAAEGGLSKIHYFGDTLKQQLIDGLESVGIKLVDADES
jgi:hypothetical protein